MYNKKALSEAISKLNAAKTPKQKPDILYTQEGQWKHPGEATRIPSDTITMDGVPYPVMAYPNVGEPVLMQPGEEHYFPEADYVDEYPMMKRGGSKGLTKGKTKSLSGINKLLTKNPLLRTYKHKLFDPTHPTFQTGSEVSVDSEPKNDFVYINRQVELSPNNYGTQQVAVPRNTTNVYKPVPLSTENLISYLELKEKYPDIHEKIKNDWQKNPDRISFEEYLQSTGWDQPATIENIKQPYEGNRKWEELIESCPECLLTKGKHFERDDQGNIYVVQNPVRLPLDFWEKMYDENYNIEDFITIDTGIKEEDVVLKEVASTPEEYKNLRYHQEWNPFTKRQEVMSPKQHQMLNREAYKLQNKGIQPTSDNMPVFQNRELLDQTSRKPIGTRSWNTNSGWSWQEGDIIGTDSEKLPNTSGNRLMNKKEKKLIAQSDNPSTTNRLFLDKSSITKRKKTLFNSADSFQPDNQNNFIEADLTEEEIEQYKKGGYVIEELPQAQSGLASQFLERAKQAQQRNPERFAEETRNLQMKKFAKDMAEANVPKTRAEADAMIESGQLKVETIAQKQAREKREAEAREQQRVAALKAYEQRVNTPGYNAWTGLPGESWRDMLAAEAAPLAAQFRVSQGDNFFDDYINPAAWVGSMAKDLGEAPKRAQQENSYLPYLTSIGMPVLGGALAGAGAKNTGQFVNNVVNPVAGVGLGKYLTTQTPLKNTYKLNPWAYKVQPTDIPLQGKNLEGYIAGYKPENNVGQILKKDWLRNYKPIKNNTGVDLQPTINFQENLHRSQALAGVNKIKNAHPLDIELTQFHNLNKSLQNAATEAQELARKKVLLGSISNPTQKNVEIFGKQMEKYYPEFKDEILKASEAPFSRRIGHGVEGSVYEFKDYPEYVIKLGNAIKEQKDFLEKAAALRDRKNIAVPIRGSVTDYPKNDIAYIMPNLNNPNLGKRTGSVEANLREDLDAIEKAGLFVESKNPENIQFNKNTNSFDIYDLQNKEVSFYGKDHALEQNLNWARFIDKQAADALKRKNMTTKELEERILEKLKNKDYKPVEVPGQLPGSPNTTIAPTKMGPSFGMDMSKYEIKNPDYFTQLLNTYDSKTLSATNKKFYKDLINSVKKQNGLVTERQYNELQRLKTGNFNFGKKGYANGGNVSNYIERELNPKQIEWYKSQGYNVEELD
jgi:hypothetical protein